MCPAALSQVDTRAAWIAEKRRREAAEARLRECTEELSLVRRELSAVHADLTMLRRQAIASRYDAWSGRKIGVLPKLRPGTPA